MAANYTSDFKARAREFIQEHWESQSDLEMANSLKISERGIERIRISMGLNRNDLSRMKREKYREYMIPDSLKRVQKGKTFDYRAYVGKIAAECNNDMKLIRYFAARQRN